MITLLIKDKKSTDQPKKYTFDQNLIKLGRLRDNDVPLRETNISRQHAIITFSNWEYRITDISTNGTFLNGELIGKNNEKILRSGDNIEIGNFVINVEIESDLKKFEKTSVIIQHSFSDSLIGNSKSFFPYIEVKSGLTSGEKYEFIEEFEEIILGRSPDCDIQIPHKSVSKNHAKIVKRGKEFELIDLNSSNGTYVNGVKIEGSVKLKDRDEIILGQGEEKNKIKIIFINSEEKEGEKTVEKVEKKSEVEEPKIKEELKESEEKKEVSQKVQEVVQDVEEIEGKDEEEADDTNAEIDVTNPNIKRSELPVLEEEKSLKFGTLEYLLIGLAILLGIVTLIIIIYSVLS